VTGLTLRPNRYLGRDGWFEKYGVYDRSGEMVAEFKIETDVLEFIAYKNRRAA
jgi:hypothetical protein